MHSSTSEQTQSIHTVREAVGVFHDVDSFEAAINELQSSGFDRSEISLLASEEAVTGKLGHVYSSAEELEDAPDTPRAVYVGDDAVGQGQAAVIGGLFMLGTFAAIGAIVASGGTLAATIFAVTAGGGGGGALGLAIAQRMGTHHADYISEQLSKGGLLLWVRTRDPEHEKLALEVLNTHGADDAHIHGFEPSHEPAANPLTGVNVDPFLPGAPV